MLLSSKTMKVYRYTLVTLVLATFLYTITVALELEVFERTLALLHRFEDFEIDEFIIPLLIVATGILCDALRLSYKKQLSLEKQRERLDIFQTTMRTVQDIVGNFLNNLLLFVMEAENSRAIEEEKIEELTNLIYETSEKLNQLADFKTIVAKYDSNEAQSIDMTKSS